MLVAQFETSKLQSTPIAYRDQERIPTSLIIHTFQDDGRKQ